MVSWKINLERPLEVLPIDECCFLLLIVGSKHSGKLNCMSKNLSNSNINNVITKSPRRKNKTISFDLKVGPTLRTLAGLFLHLQLVGACYTQ